MALSTRVVDKLRGPVRLRVYSIVSIHKGDLSPNSRKHVKNGEKSLSLSPVTRFCYYVSMFGFGMSAFKGTVSPV